MFASRRTPSSDSGWIAPSSSIRNARTPRDPRTSYSTLSYRKERIVMFRKCLLAALTVSVFGLIAVPTARADEWNKKTVITFSQPVEVAGHVLPAGTYTFQLADSPSDRHLVQIYGADGRIIATVLAIPDYRLTATDETVMTFNEASAGSPQPIRAWFYPG